MHTEQQQAFNEALLKLCILIYQSDGRITLNEQDYFQAVSDKIHWQGEEEMEDFLQRSIYEVRQVIDKQQEKDFINDLRDALSVDAKKAITVARGLSYIDGHLADEEQAILDYLQRKALAKALN